MSNAAVTPALARGAGLLVAASEVHGLGVFADRRFTAGDVIEECPVLVVPAIQRGLIDGTSLFEYYFDWAGDGGLALGFGSLYNHSGRPNAAYEKHLDQALLVIRALRDIEPGEEITFNYSGEPG